jgi:hypothetical protein
MKNWIDALTLWWMVEWRFFLSFILLLLTFWLFNLLGSPVSEESFLASTSQVVFSIGDKTYYYTPAGNVFVLISFFLFYLIGASAKHAINHPFGKRLIKLNYKGSNVDSVSWSDGLSLQFSLAWRIFALYMIYSVILIALDVKEVVENIDGSVHTTYTMEWIEWALPIIFGVISARLFLTRPLISNKKYSIIDNTN